jgi:integrase
VTDLGRGRWRVRVFVGTDPVTGRPRQVERTVTAKTKAEATRQLDDLRAEVRQAPQAGSNATVRHVVEEFIRHSGARGRAPRTIHSAERSLDLVIGPAIGDIPVGDLTPFHIDGLYRGQIDAGRSPATVRRHHAVLSAALSQAVRWRWIDENPAALATLPAPAHEPVTVPTPHEVAALLRSADGTSDVWGLLIRLAILTGARRGELAGLQWRDIDGADLRIRRSVYRLDHESFVKGPKGGRERSIPIEPGLALVLDSWRKRCDKVAAGAGVEIPADGYIASSMADCSQPVNIDSLTPAVRRASAAAGVPHIHLHSLRHLAATEMLAAGVSPSDAAALLGHADGGRLALQVYSHATDDRQRAAAAVLGKSLRLKIANPK